MESLPPPSLLYLWDKRTFYISPLFEPISLSQGVACFVVCLDGGIKCRLSGEEDIICKSVLLPPGATVFADTGDSVIACCMLDPIGLDFAMLSPLMRYKTKNMAYTIENEAHYIACFQDMHQAQYPSDLAYAQLEQLIAPKKRLQNTHYKIDPRIERVIEMIKLNIDENLTIESIAEHVQLSIPRLVQLFKLQTGVPIRSYRQWRRLYCAAVLAAKTNNINTAAIEAGFFDASHFSRTFKKMLGVKPSVILGQPNSIKIILPST